MSQNIPPRVIPPGGDDNDGRPSGGTEKEQYSLDEMMKALRDKEREKEEKGEVVTRADGSVARKVKRRKRRSDQPEKPASDTPEKQKKRLLVKLIIAASCVLALFLGALFLLVSHNSKGHWEKLEETASDWSGAEVKFSGHKRTPFAASLKEAKFKWPAASYLKNLEIKTLEGDVSFFNYIGARPGGLQFGGKVGTLEIGMPTASGDVGEDYDEDEFPFTFEQYYCQALDVKFGESENFAIKGTSAVFNHVSNAGFQTTLDQGLLKVKGWNDFPISSAVLRFEDGVVAIKSLSLKQPNEFESALAASLKVSGDLPLFPGKKALLETSTERFVLGGLLGTRLSQLFSGQVTQSTGTIEYSLGEDEIDEVGMTFQAESVVMSQFPFLNNLRELFPSQNLEEIVFDTGFKKAAITGVFRARPEGVALEKIEMAQKGNLRLTGGLIIANSGQIAGSVELSINRAFFTAEPGMSSHPILRGTEGTGYAVARFKLGGTLEEPDDTFRQVMGMAATLPAAPAGQSTVGEDLWKKIQE